MDLWSIQAENDLVDAILTYGQLTNSAKNARYGRVNRWSWVWVAMAQKKHRLSLRAMKARWKKEIRETLSQCEMAKPYVQSPITGRECRETIAELWGTRIALPKSDVMDGVKFVEALVDSEDDSGRGDAKID